jgi:ribonuclease P/MRP protein subunit POP5
VKYVNPLTKLCVIRVSREDHQKVWAAITMVRSIGKIPVSFNLLDVSGEWTIDDGTTSVLFFFLLQMV